MKKILPYILVILISTALSVSTMLLIHPSKKGKTGYVQLAKVFSDFELSKTLDAQLKQTTTTRKNIVDSLEFIAKTLYTQASNDQKNKKLIDDFEMAQRQYLYQKEQFEESAGAIEEQYNQQIWTQLNEYIKQYGQENGYSYVFGAAGSGTIMYGSEAEDLTEEVLKYVNEKYQGK